MGNKDNKDENNINDYQDYQNCNLLWLDKNVNNCENIYYQDLIKKITKIKFSPFIEINDCINKLKKIEFEKTFVLVSGSLSNDFFIELEKNINIIKVLPVIMIFTRLRNVKSIKNNKINNNFKLFDIDLVFYTFDQIKNQLKIKNVYSPNNIETTKFENDETFSFESITKKEDLILPLYYPDFIDYPSKNEIIEFNKFLLDRYSKTSKLKEIIEQLFLNIKIPCEILFKYWIRAYTAQSNFCYEMNNNLERKLGKDYEIVIKVLYNGLKKEYIKPFTERNLYRGARIKKSELEYIKKSFENKKDKKEELPACICYNKAFLSLSIEENVGYKIMRNRAKKDNEEYVLYELKKGNEIDKKYASNTNIEEFSVNKEKEILFFPFSSFEIYKEPEERIYNSKKYYRIYLSYLGQYKEKIADKKGTIPETDFTKDLFSTEVVEKFEIEKEKSFEFSFPISKYITEEKKKNSIEAIYEITDDDINKTIKILNHNDINKEEIEKKCDIYFGDKKIDFNYEYTFDKPGKYLFKFIFNDLLTNTSNLFEECKTLISLDFTKFKTNYITDMNNMFNGCSLLKSLDLSNFKTKHVTNMKQMFNNCEKLVNLDVSSFDIINVTDMSYMFNNCKSLNILNLSNFKTKSVKSMKGMFNNCNSLNFINISNFETTDVIDMSEMFNLCSSLNSLNLSKFNTYNVENMYKMFYKCSSLINLNLENFKTPNLKNIQNMFSECSSLISLNIDNFTTNNVDNMNELFKNCSSLMTLNLKNFDTTKVNTMENMFINCNSLTILYISKSFKIKNNIFEGLNKNCKINCNDKELNLNDLEFNNIHNNVILDNSFSSTHTINLLRQNDIDVQNIINNNKKNERDNNVKKSLNSNDSH